MPRQLDPGATLAAVYPDVAATWHPTANHPLTPGTVASTASRRVMWRCSAGHEWDDIVATRIGMPAWKKGVRAACRVCSGYHAIVTFDCGHTAEVKAEFSDPARRCPTCRKEAFARRQEVFAVGQALAAVHFEDDKDTANKLVDAVDATGLPGPLRPAWRLHAVKAMRATVARERHHGVIGAVEVAKAALTVPDLASLVPATVLESAELLGSPVTLFGKAYWPAGWRHLTDAPPTRTATDKVAVASLRTHLTGLLAGMAGGAVAVNTMLPT